MSSSNKRIGLPVDVQENIIQNIQRIFPSSVNKELIRTVLIKEDWDLEKSLQFLHQTLSSFNKDNKSAGKANKNNKATNQLNKVQNQQNVDKQMPKPQKQQKKTENSSTNQNQNKKKIENASAQQKKLDLFKKGPALKQKLKPDSVEQGDWVMIDNPLLPTQPAPAQPSPKSDDKTVSNESKAARKKKLIQNYNIIKHFGDAVNRISAYIKEGIKVMILLRGCSGCGKTTYANQLLQKEGAKYPENHIFSTDTYFVQSDGSYSFKFELLQEAHDWNQKLVQIAMLEGRSPVFVDNTNTRLWEMREYAVMAVKYGYVLETLEPPTPWFFNEDILFRKTNHSTPRETIRKMLDRYEANLTGEDVIRNLQLVYPPHLTPPQGVIAGFDTPMSKNHKKQLNRPLNNSADRISKNNEVKSKINVLLNKKIENSTTYLNDDTRERSFMLKNWSHLTGHAPNFPSFSNEIQNSKLSTFGSTNRNISMFPSVKPNDKPFFVPPNQGAGSPVSFGVMSRSYEYLPRNNALKSREEKGNFESTVELSGLGGISEQNSTKLDIPCNEIVKQQKEEIYGSSLTPAIDNLDSKEDDASDFYESESEPENMTSSDSLVTSDDSGQGVENVTSYGKYECDLEYVLVSDDNRITFQRSHCEMKDIVTLEAFKVSSSGSAPVTSKEFEEYLMEFISASDKDMPPAVNPAQGTEKTECYLQVEQISNSDLPSQSLSQTADTVNKSQKCFTADSSMTSDNASFEIPQQAESGSDNREKGVLVRNPDFNSYPNSHTPSKPEIALDEATSTSDNNILEKHERSPINTLHMLFPKVSRDNLVEIFGSGHVDIDWAVGLLLDSGQEMIAHKTSVILSESNPKTEFSPSFSTKEQDGVTRDFDGNAKVCQSNPHTNPLSDQMGQSFSEFLQGNEGISCSSSGKFSQNSKSLESNDQTFKDIGKNKDFCSSSLNQSNRSLGAIQKNINFVGDWDYSKGIPKTMPVETPKMQRDLSPRLCCKISVTTNTNYADFDTLHKVNSNQDYVCHDLSKILTGNPSFISVSTPHFPSSSILMLDKGVMTTDIETNKIGESGVERLALMFPRVSRDNLEELFEKCQGDIDWAAGLLLDSGQEMSELHTSLEPLESTSEKSKPDEDQDPVEKDQDKPPSEKKKRKRSGKRVRLARKENEELQKQLQSNFVLNENHYSSERMRNHFQKNNPNKISVSECEEIPKSSEGNEDDDSNIENISDNSEEEIVFMMDSDFILQLQSRFGGLLRPNMLGEKTVVNLPLSLALQLHSYVMDSVQQHIQEENIFTDEDEEYARTLQEEENRARGAPSLLEIMDEEVALRKTQKETANGRSMASALSKQLLLERFPKMDPTTLASILDDTNHSLHQATFVLSSAGHEQAEPDSQAESLPEEVEEKSTLTREEAIKQADAYGDVASQLYELRKDCLRKSQKAYREGNHSVALYYSDMARWYMERIEKSNSMAAKAILTGYEGWTTLDLHFLQVNEALNVLDLFVDEVIRDLQSSNNRRAVVYVITGRGIHSSGGRPRLKPAVQSRLIKRDLRFSEQNPGMLRVTIPRTALTSYKQQIETTT